MRVRENRLLDRLSEKRLPDLRGAHTEILKRAELLAPDDRRLVELALRNGLTQRQLADLFALPCGTICRRLRRLINRLHDPVIGSLLDGSASLKPEARQLAVEHLVQGHTVRELADKHRMSRSTVRQLLHYIRGWHRGMSSKFERRR